MQLHTTGRTVECTLPRRWHVRIIFCSSPYQSSDHPDAAQRMFLTLSDLKQQVYPARPPSRASHHHVGLPKALDRFARHLVDDAANRSDHARVLLPTSKARPIAPPVSCLISQAHKYTSDLLHGCGSVFRLVLRRDGRGWRLGSNGHVTFTNGSRQEARGHFAFRDYTILVEIELRRARTRRCIHRWKSGATPRVW